MGNALKSCIGDAITELQQKHPDMPRDQQVAIALSKCGQSSKDLNLTDPEHERWQQVFTDTYRETGDVALAEQAAWGALRKQMVLARLGRKSAADDSESPNDTERSSDDVVRGWAMLFTDDDNPDVDGQFFDDDTATLLDYYPSAPLWYEHGGDPAYGAAPIGQRVGAKVYRRGVVLEHALDTTHPQYSRTSQEIDDGMLTYSTDSILHYVEQGFEPATGRLGVWFAAGCSLTKTPAEPALGMVTRQAYFQAVKSAAVEAREAQDAGRPLPLSTSNISKGNPPMDALLKVLAALFGVAAERDAVKSAVTDLTARMAEPAPADGQAPADAPQIDMATLLQVLGLPADAAPESIVAALQALLATLQPEAAPAGGGMMSAKPDAAAVKSAAEWLANHAPAASGIPFHTPGGEGDGQPTPPGQKSTKYGSVNYNRGAKLPGLAELVLGVVGRKSESAMKAMGYSVGPNGGYWLRQEVADQMIELFRAQTVIDKLGATYVPMNGIETLTYRKQLTGSTATYRGEGQAINQSQPTYGMVQLQLKELTAGTRVNRRLLKNSVVNLESMLRDDLQMGLNLRADKAALLGTGGIPNETGASGAEPRGILNTTGVTSTPLGTNGAVPTIKDFTDGWGRIEDANVPVSDKWGIAYSPRTKRTMDNLTDTTGQLLPRARWTQGYKDFATTQIPNTLTVGSKSDCSEVFLGAWEYLIVGLGQSVEIIVDESIYVLSGEVYIEATMMHDCGVSHPEAFQVLTGVRA